MIVGDVKLNKRNHIKSLLFRSTEKIFTDFFIAFKNDRYVDPKMIGKEIKLF